MHGCVPVWPCVCVLAHVCACTLSCLHRRGVCVSRACREQAVSHVCVCLCVCCGWPVPQDTRKDMPDGTNSLRRPLPPVCMLAPRGKHTYCVLHSAFGSQPLSFSQDKPPIPEVRSPLTARDSNLIRILCVCLQHSAQGAARGSVSPLSLQPGRHPKCRSSQPSRGHPGPPPAGGTRLDANHQTSGASMDHDRARM